MKNQLKMVSRFYGLVWELTRTRCWPLIYKEYRTYGGTVHLFQKKVNNHISPPIGRETFFLKRGIQKRKLCILHCYDIVPGP
jgi:hypothetical protein